jgi:hypothetical protein
MLPVNFLSISVRFEDFQVFNISLSINFLPPLGSISMTASYPALSPIVQVKSY